MTFRIRPSVSGPTGTEIGAPRSTAFMPRTRPSAGFIEMQRTRFSPRCWATSVIRSIGTVESPSGSVMWTAFRMDGRCPPGNSTSTVAPMTWTTLPSTAMFFLCWPAGRGTSAAAASSRAAAPETISMSSLVIFAWRARL